jgi:HEAT repeat protein
MMRTFVTVMAVLAVVGCTPEPRFRGKTARTWAAELKHKNQSERWHAAQALANLGPHAHEAVPALVEALKDEDAILRTEAASALARIGPAAKPAVPALVEALKDDYGPAREAAAATLRALDPETAKRAAAGRRE